jgi:hypothetical protein
MTLIAKMRIVEIRKPALVQMVAAAYESFRVECTGFLGGSRRGDNFEILVAQPAQIVERKPSSSDYGGEWKRIKYVVGRGYDFLGGFHSHLSTYIRRKKKRFVDEGTVTLSPNDRDTIEEQYPTGIEIVIALNPSQRMGASALGMHKLRGYLSNGNGQKYRIEMGAYYLDESARKRKAELHVSRRVLNAVFG